MTRTIGPQTTLAELAIVIASFGLTLECRLTVDGAAYYACVYDGDAMECALGSALDEAIASAIDNYKIATALAMKAGIH